MLFSRLSGRAAALGFATLLGFGLCASPVMADPQPFKTDAEDLRISLGLIPTTQSLRDSGNRLLEALKNEKSAPDLRCYLVGRLHGNAEALSVELQRYPKYRDAGVQLSADAALLPAYCDESVRTPQGDIRYQDEEYLAGVLSQLGKTNTKILALIQEDENRKNEIKDQVEATKKKVIDHFDRLKSEAEKTLEKARLEADRLKNEGNKALDRAGIKGFKF